MPCSVYWNPATSLQFRINDGLFCPQSVGFVVLCYCVFYCFDFWPYLKSTAANIQKHKKQTVLWFVVGFAVSRGVYTGVRVLGCTDAVVIFLGVYSQAVVV